MLMSWKPAVVMAVSVSRLVWQPPTKMGQMTSARRWALARPEVSAWMCSK
jgi:hypothetical protein